MNADEIKTQHLQVFGPELGPTFNELYDEVIWLHAKWLEYRKLFAKSQERIELLNSTASLFFRVVHDVFWNDVLLHIARLTDPPSQQSHENLTLLRLAAAVPDPQLKLTVQARTTEAETATVFARQLRNKKLAHLDFDHAIDPSNYQLEGASRQKIEDALESFRNILNPILSAYGLGTTGFDRFFAPGDSDALVWYLSAGAKFDELHRKCDFGGTIVRSDFDLPKV